MKSFRKKSSRVTEGSVVTTGALAKRLKRRRLFLAMLLVAMCALGLFIFGRVRTALEDSAAYEEYLDDHENVGTKLLAYRDTFRIWNADDTGNDINALLSMGKVYCRNGLLISPGKGSAFTVKRDGKEVGSINGPISYINVVGKKAYYRKDKSRNIVKYDFKKNKASRVAKGNYGEVLVCEGRIYAIDLADNNHIISMTKKGKDKRVECDLCVNTFAVCGEEIILLDNEQRLGIYQPTSKDEEQFRILARGVERFYLNGDVVAESGNKVFRINMSSGRTNEIFTSGNEGMRLVGAYDDALFIQEKGKLKTALGKDKKTVVKKKHKLYQSLVMADDEVCYVLVTDDSNDSRPTTKLKTIKAVKTKK